MVSWKSLIFQIVVAGVICYGSPANADTVFRCDGCTRAQQYNAAKNGPQGWTYVIDYENSALSLWQVKYDRETRENFVYPRQVDSVTYNRYLYILDTKIQAQVAGSPLVVINIGPGQYNGTLFARDPFGGFSNISAYDVVNSATVRNQLGINLAEAMSITGTQSVTLNNLGVTLNSVIMGLGYPAGFKIVITWKDGTRTTFIIDSSTANQARYAAGESRDASGNPIPDASATTSSGGGSYAGQYYFSTMDSLENWVRTAINYGIPVTGGQSGSTRLQCTWDGVALSCKRI